MNNETKCCIDQCERPLDQNFWNTQYSQNNTGWDLGEVSPPLKIFFDNLPEKKSRILIPGCGNAYEAEYLLKSGFTNVTLIDIAPLAVQKLQSKFAGRKEIKIVLGDFFEHQGQYDLIIEQTFFCALPPVLRQKYVWKMHSLLAEKGMIAGLLFDRYFEQGPPFGGNKSEYELLFTAAFHFKTYESCNTSSAPRSGTELWFEFQKNNQVKVNFYYFEGITCSDCVREVTNKLVLLPEVLNVSIGTDFKTLLLVSRVEIPLEKLESEISFDKKYKLIKTA